MMKTLRIIITDTHFGVKNNSQRWLNKQIEGLRELREYIKHADYDNKLLIHCGDVFDSRSTVNNMVLKNVRDELYALADEVNKFYIIAGNHDYYSPNEADSEINSIDIHINHPNIIKVTNEPLFADGMYLVPWYKFGNDDYAKYDIVFTHTDLFGISPVSRIIAGHIHTPYKSSLGDKYCYNIGSTFATTFADANAERGFYTIEDDNWNDITFHPLSTPIRFYRIDSNDENFFDIISLRDFDFLRIFINSEHRANGKYTDVIEYYQSICNNVEVIIYDNIQSTDCNIKNLDFDEIIHDCIPDHLKEKYEVIKNEQYQES